MSPRIPIRLLAVQSDERLARLVREGHERAFDALVHRYRRPLLCYCRRIGLGESRAEDVLQLVLLNAWLALAGGTEVRELKPWLYRIAHNGAINALRGPFERNGDLLAAASVPVERCAEDDFDSRIAVRDALADVAALPPLQRQAILLTALEGKTHDEVAGLLGVNQDAVRGLLYRARTTLRSAAAFTPQPLVAWASSGAGSAGSATARLSEVSAGGALTGALLKGAAVAITAGVLVGGPSVLPVRSHAAQRPSGRTRAGGSAQTSAARTAFDTGTTAASAAATAPSDALAPSPSAGAAPRASARRRGGATPSRRGRRSPDEGLRAPAAGLLGTGRLESGRPGSADAGERQPADIGERYQAAGGETRESGRGETNEAARYTDTRGTEGDPARDPRTAPRPGGEVIDGGGTGGSGSFAGAQTLSSGDSAEAQRDGPYSTPQGGGAAPMREG